MKNWYTNKTKLGMLALLALFLVTVGAFAVSNTSSQLGAQGAPVDGVEVDVDLKEGKKGKDGKNLPPASGVVEKKTAANGKITYNVKNRRSKVATVSDLHITVLEPEGAKIDSISDVGNPLSETSITDNGKTANLERPQGGPSLGHGETQEVTLLFKDKDGNVLDEKDVKVQMRWTKGGNFVVVLGPRDVGGINRGMLGIGGLSDEGLSVHYGDNDESTFAAPAITLGENYDFRFNNGDLLLSLNRGAEFTNAGGVTIEAYDQNGNPINDGGRISFGTPRIDSMGNLVFRVMRDADDPLHALIVVRGATVTNFDQMGVGEEVLVTYQCSALAGYILEEAEHIATIVSE